jgi:hypothetical protein
VDQNQLGYLLRQQQQAVSAEVTQALVSFKQAMEAQLANEQVARRQLQQRLDDMGQYTKELEGKLSFDREQPTRIMNIDNVPGPRVPQWYVVRVPFSYNVTTQAYQSVEIDPSGPFICTQMQAYYRVTDTDASRDDFLAQTLPISAYPLILQQGGGVSPATLQTNLAQQPEFDIQIEIAGSGRFWTGPSAVPGAAFYGFNQPLYTGIFGWIDMSDRVKVYAIPTKAVPVAGEVIFVMHGFQILRPMRLAELLGAA